MLFHILVGGMVDIYADVAYVWYTVTFSSHTIINSNTIVKVKRQYLIVQ